MINPKFHFITVSLGGHCLRSFLDLARVPSLATWAVFILLTLKVFIRSIRPCLQNIGPLSSYKFGILGNGCTLNT